MKLNVVDETAVLEERVNAVFALGVPQLDCFVVAPWDDEAAVGGKPAINNKDDDIMSLHIILNGNCNSPRTAGGTYYARWSSFFRNIEVIV